MVAANSGTEVCPATLTPVDPATRSHASTSRLNRGQVDPNVSIDLTERNLTARVAAEWRVDPPLEGVVSGPYAELEIQGSSLRHDEWQVEKGARNLDRAMLGERCNSGANEFEMSCTWHERIATARDMFADYPLAVPAERSRVRGLTGSGFAAALEPGMRTRGRSRQGATMPFL